MRYLTLLLAVPLMFAGRAAAQSTGAAGLLAQPSEALVMCRSRVPLAADSADQRLEWMLAGGREITVTYDSAGSPIRLDIIGPDETNGGRAIGLTVRFRANPPRGATNSAGGAAQPMTDTDLAHASALAMWLWQRRCGARTSERLPPRADSLVSEIELGNRRPTGDYYVQRRLRALDGRLLRADRISSVCLSLSLAPDALNRAGALAPPEIIGELPSLSAWRRFPQLGAAAPSDTMLMIALLEVTPMDAASPPMFIPDLDSAAALRREFVARDIPVLSWRCGARRTFYVWDSRRAVLFTWWGK